VKLNEDLKHLQAKRKKISDKGRKDAAKAEVRAASARPKAALPSHVLPGPAFPAHFCPARPGLAQLYPARFIHLCQSVLSCLPQCQPAQLPGLAQFCPAQPGPALPWSSPNRPSARELCIMYERPSCSMHFTAALRWVCCVSGENVPTEMACGALCTMQHLFIA
jgi:hypothetical protein